MEEEISSLYKVIDDAGLTKAELEQQMESMRAELRHLEHNHEQVPKTLTRVASLRPTCSAKLSLHVPARQDVRVLYNQMAGREVDEPDAPIETSLDQILAYIRNHWEKVTERNRAETDNYLECKVGVPRRLRWPPFSSLLASLMDWVFARVRECVRAGGAVREQQTESAGGACGGAEGRVQRHRL